MALVKGMEKKRRILCAREVQNTIRDSVHRELVDAIDHYGLDAFYEYGESFIRCKTTGSEFLFKGLRHNIKEVKSTTGVDICWVEEAETVSEESWRVLIPTIRAPGSEIWLTWNPEKEDSPTHKRFVLNPPPRSNIVEMSYRDNPWFPKELEEERQRDLQLDPELYAHVWEGALLSKTDAQILSGKYRVADFMPSHNWDGPYLGLDFGFANDPTAAVKCWVYENRLYVEYEAGRTKLELDDTADYLKARIPDIERYVIRADSARPESISYLARHGLSRVEAVKKWPKSVEDGIAHLRSYQEIIIHPRCEQTVKEARLYSYKTDRQSGDVLPVVVDAYNHFIDAIRYALEPMIKRDSPMGISLRVAM